MSKIYSLTVLALAISMLTGCSLYAPQPPATPAPLKPIEASTPAQPESTIASAEPASTSAPLPTSPSTTPTPINTVEELPILSMPLQGITHQEGGFSFVVKEMLYDQDGLSFRVEAINSSGTTQYLHYRQGKRGEFDELPLLKDQSGQEYYVQNIAEDDPLPMERGTRYEAVWRFGFLPQDAYAVKLGINMRQQVIGLWFADEGEPSFYSPKILLRSNSAREKAEAEIGITEKRYCLTVALTRISIGPSGIGCSISVQNEEDSGVIYDLFQGGKPELADATGQRYLLDRWSYLDCKGRGIKGMRNIAPGDHKECTIHFYPAPEAGTSMILAFFPTEDSEELEPMAFQFGAP